MIPTIKRRAFITLLGAAMAASPLAARAEPGPRRIGFMVNFHADGADGRVRHAAFRDALQKLGWTEGGNLAIEYRWEASTTGPIQNHAAAMVKRSPAVIVVQGSILSEALLRETSTTPVVFIGASDPLASGLVKSMAHPGGNLTGFTNFEFTIGGKWLQTIKDVAPTTQRVMFVGTRSNIGNLGLYRAAETAAPALQMQTVGAFLNDGTEVGRAIDAFAQQPNGGLVMLPGNLGTDNRDLIVALAAKHRLPAIYPYRAYVEAGGLMSYDTDVLDLYRRAASYVDRILRGEKPGDLPVQIPTKYELVINLKVAKTLGLKIPEAFLLRADEVIE